MNDQTPRFDISVLMPVLLKEPSYSALRQLENSIASVISQRFPARMELLIVDDGSAFPIKDMLQRVNCDLPDTVRIIRSERNNGLTYALNWGLRSAKYDLIARMDADDDWLPGKIEKQIQRFSADQDLSIVGTGMTVKFENGSEPEPHIRPDGWSQLLRFSIDVGCPFPHGSILARKDIFLLLGGYPQGASVAHCEDFALWSIWLRFFKPAMIEELFYNYFVSASSVSGAHWDQQVSISNAIRMNLAKLNVADTTPDSISELANVLNITVIQAGVLCYRLWHYRPAAALPSAAIQLIQSILVDRFIVHDKMRHRPKPIELPGLLDGFAAGNALTMFPDTKTVTVN